MSFKDKIKILRKCCDEIEADFLTITNMVCGETQELPPTPTKLPDNLALSPQIKETVSTPAPIQVSTIKVESQPPKTTTQPTVVQPVSPQQPTKVIPHVLASMWGNKADEDSGDWKSLYYPEFKALPHGGAENSWVALPGVVPKGTKVMLQYCKPDGEALGAWCGPYSVADLGPWWDGTDGKSRRPEWFDYYWRTGDRPKSETLKTDPRGRQTNGAGIDLTPKCVAELINGNVETLWYKPIMIHVNIQVIEPTPTDHPTEMITPHFAWMEFEYSATAAKYGIDNRIPAEIKPSIEALCTGLLEPIRTWANGPVRISSGYRCVALDEKVHALQGTLVSNEREHTKGLAADIDHVHGHTIKEVFNYIKANLDYDRLLWEGSFIHVSFVRGRNRKQILSSPT